MTSKNSVTNSEFFSKDLYSLIVQWILPCDYHIRTSAKGRNIDILQIYQVLLMIAALLVFIFVSSVLVIMLILYANTMTQP